MSLHQLVAEAWRYLEGRHDIADILREILGQHALDSSHQVQEDTAGNIEVSLRIIIWIKVILDLQRTYLSGNVSGVNECPPYLLPCLLPSEPVFSIIMYLIQVKSKLFPSQTTIMTREFASQRYFIAQTILSGFRLLLLRNEIVSPQNKRLLQRAIIYAWQHDRLTGVEQFVVSDVFSELLDQIPTDESQVRESFVSEWAKAHLPTFSAGLYPLDIRTDAFLPDVMANLANDEPDWIEFYWILFDVLWATESSLIQRHVDLRQSSTSGTPDGDEGHADGVLEQGKQLRVHLIAAIFERPSSTDVAPRPYLLESLSSALLAGQRHEIVSTGLHQTDSLVPAQARTGRFRSLNSSRSPIEMTRNLETSLTEFIEWLGKRQSGFQQLQFHTNPIRQNLRLVMKDWIKRTSSADVETQTKDLDGPLLPIYIVNCPQLHPVPRKLLEYKLRWCDKWAYESLQSNPPFLNWKESVSCPRCNTAEAKIKHARLFEPLQEMEAMLEPYLMDNYSLSQYSTADSLSCDMASISESDSNPISPPIMPSSTISPAALTPSATFSSPISPSAISLPTLSPAAPFYFTDSPISPYSESLNVPIAIPRDVDLPIPVSPTQNSLSPLSSHSDASDPRTNSSSVKSAQSTTSLGKLKSSSRSVRIMGSIRKKHHSEKQGSTLPPSPRFAFSATGHSLLFWGKSSSSLVRFDIPSNDVTPVLGCRYDVSQIEAAAAGNQRCAIVSANGEKWRLFIYNGVETVPEAEIEIESSMRNPQICVEVSRDDKYAATSLNDQIQIYRLGKPARQVAFHHQIQVQELQGGQLHQRTVLVNQPKVQFDADIDSAAPDLPKTDTGWFGASKTLSSKEAAEEAQRQSAMIGRKISFSPDSRFLAVATQLGDHRVYVDVWDCTREPVGTISENSRSFKLPPWTLNDGDLTTIFYDTFRRCAILTAFLGKEYPVMIPFPGYDELQNEEYSTKIVHAAQSPSGSSFTVANGMTELIQFEYTPKGILSSRKLKKAASKIGNAAFKPGCLALAQPQENVVQAFWIKDGKMMLRTIKMGNGESYRDCDIRAHYDRLAGAAKTIVLTRAPTLRIPELSGQ
ncbi:hypothetical protein K432DRAFT_400416 [Lepidopterella palustris CBS 459.81]|uniref:Uncharacterized protein n=1 Tax=Lepidopterella palustris CBS 459.81 TaxID=1314670 RepID=A0A8E2EK85_9PEZI|nr:hypothetical protein K432DRAFT_400416 [Lepidopterella palustris CBS 459.81]